MNGDYFNWQKMPLYGGVTAMKATQYKSINGYSNEYWGWGCEDEDLAYRLTNSKANLSIQEAQSKAGFTMPQYGKISNRKHSILSILFQKTVLQDSSQARPREFR